MVAAVSAGGSTFGSAVGSSVRSSVVSKYGSAFVVAVESLVGTKSVVVVLSAV